VLDSSSGTLLGISKSVEMSNDEDLVDEVDDTEREDENSHNVEEVQVVKYDLSFI